MRCGNPAARAPVVDWFERAAIGASILCLIHRVGLPLLLAALPALSRAFALPEDLHVWILAFAAPASAGALALGARQHRAWGPLAAGSFGVALLSAGALLLLGTSLETPVTLAGSCFLVTAHLANWRLRHRSHCHG
jgi:hypothetical protein